MDPTALIIGAFGVGSLSLTFAKYTIERRKMMQLEDHIKNHGLTLNIKSSPTNSPNS
jgi:hypothetical protein